MTRPIPPDPGAYPSAISHFGALCDETLRVLERLSGAGLSWLTVGFDAPACQIDPAAPVALMVRVPSDSDGIAEWATVARLYPGATCTAALGADCAHLYCYAGRVRLGVIARGEAGEAMGRAVIAGASA